MGSSASENTYRSIVTRRGGVPSPPENGKDHDYSKLKLKIPLFWFHALRCL